MTTFNQILFGTHTASPFGVNNNIASWVDEFGKDILNTSQTVSITPEKYLHGSIRYPSGTFSNYLQWDDEYICGINGYLKEVFQRSNVYTDTVNSISSYGQPKKYPINDFCEYARDYVPNSQIHASLNIYTQTIEEVYASINKFRTALNEDSRVIYWELGNEINNSPYQDFVNDATEPGSFPNLTGDDLAAAKEYWPSERYDPDQAAQKSAVICRYIRENYPNDKIAVTSAYTPRWVNPDGGPDQAAVPQKAWAESQLRFIPDSDYDAVIIHPYISLTDQYDALDSELIPASGKELDASFTDQDDKFWRFHATLAQEFMRLCMNDLTELWPNDKEAYLTEWGLLTHADNASFAILPQSNPSQLALNKLIDSTVNFVADGSRAVAANDYVVINETSYAKVLSISTTVSANDTLDLDGDPVSSTSDNYLVMPSTQPEGMTAATPWQMQFRACYLADMYISFIKEYLRWNGIRKLATTLYHIGIRGGGYVQLFYLSGYLNANGAVGVMLKQAVDACSKFCIPILNDSTVQYDGQSWAENRKMHPVNAALFENSSQSEQWIFLVNNSPNNRTVTLPFATSSGKAIESTSSPADPYEVVVPDSTYDVYGDLPAKVNASATMTAKAFSIYVLQNTGSAVDLNEFSLSVT